jgi:hypothetical protein
MDVHEGDRVLVDTQRIGQARRSGEVTGVEGDAAHRRLWVRWDDGHVSMLVPSSGVTVMLKESGSAAK